jgi:hypothetical protein
MGNPGSKEGRTSLLKKSSKKRLGTLEPGWDKS